MSHAQPPRSVVAIPSLCVLLILAACADGSSPVATEEARPILSLSRSSVDLSVQEGTTDPVAATVSVTNTGDGDLGGLSVSTTYGAGTEGGWLDASLDGDGAPAELTLAVSGEELEEGTYGATVSVASGEAENGAQDVSVQLTVTAPASDPLIELTPDAVTFTATEGGADPVADTVIVSNAGGGSLSGITTSVGYPDGQPTGWLTASFGNGPLVLTAETGSLAAGTYEATVEVASDAAVNSPQAVAVTFTVTSGAAADLLVEGFEATSSTSVVAGQFFEYAPFSIRNQGTLGASGVENGYYLSADSTLTPDDARLSGNSNSIIGAGESVEWAPGGGSIMIPASTPAGNYYLGVLTDEVDSVEESDETNNFQSVAITVTEPVATYTLTLDQNFADAGSVTTDPAGGTYEEGTVVSLTAVPAEGFRFSHWSGAVDGDANPVDLTMDADVAVTAHFELQPPTLNASSVSSGVFTLTWEFGWPCTGLCLGSSQDRYELEESTTSATSGFSVIASPQGRTSPYSLELSREPGTYYYRVRAIDGVSYGTSPYSAVRTVIVSDDGSVATTIRVINDLPDGVWGDNDWTLLNTIIRVRVGSTEDAVVQLTGDGQELLYPYDSTYDEADLIDITPGEEMTLEVPAYDTEYWLYIQTGYWDYDALYGIWRKHMSVVAGCDASSTYKWTTIRVFEPFGHPEVIRASDFLPDGNWYGSEYC
ncbi:MAG: CARDB domain-containing protein [Gemmatimonadota bacterium]|nr:CARDB domain-containing protein [Gemmatimonadota bacterium]